MNKIIFYLLLAFSINTTFATEIDFSQNKDIQLIIKQSDLSDFEKEQVLLVYSYKKNYSLNQMDAIDLAESFNFYIVKNDISDLKSSNIITSFISLFPFLYEQSTTIMNFFIRLLSFFLLFSFFQLFIFLTNYLNKD